LGLVAGSPYHGPVNRERANFVPATDENCHTLTGQWTLRCKKEPAMQQHAIDEKDLPPLFDEDEGACRGQDEERYPEAEKIEAILDDLLDDDNNW